MKKIVLSGFDPFAEWDENPSEVLVQNLKASHLDLEFHKVILPVSFSRAHLILQNEIKVFAPDAVISFGLAGERKKICLETRALNLMKAKNPDNDGSQFEEMKIEDLGPEELFSSLPLSKMSQLGLQENSEVDLSDSAGSFVCNHVLYKTLRRASEGSYLVGFIHLPPFEVMSLQNQMNVILKMLEAF